VRGNLVRVDLPDGTVIEYLIDGQDRRVGKKKNGVLEKQWLYKDQLRIAAELDGAGALVSRFVYASRENVPDFVIRGGNTYRVFSDHLGSPHVAVNVANVSDVLVSLEYAAFGAVTGTGSGWMPQGFAGGLYDADTGLVRFGARDYDPVSGRWTSKDPILFNGDGPNLYAYVLGDSINELDHYGEGIVDCGKAVLEFKRLRDKLAQRIKERDAVACPDAGHEKAIEQLRNAVERAREKALRHCKDPETLAELAFLALIGPTLAAMGATGAGYDALFSFQ
jgi:RHS repeat-associated protein